MKWLGKISFNGRPEYDAEGLITNAEVDTISGTLQTDIDTKSDTSHLHDDRYYTESEVDDLITTVSGKLDDHNELNNLDYASSGHTGFQPSGDYVTDSELTTLSGALKNDIDTKSDTSHLHDDRYYTETETDTISGSLQTNIDGKSDTSHLHDDRYYTETELNEGQLDIRYYTESEVDTISGSLDTAKSDINHSHTESDISNLDKYTQAEVDSLITTISGKLDDHNELNNLDYASAGHTGFQPSGDYLTDSEFSTYSGTLQSQIDDKSDTSHLHDDRYYTESEIDTISGSLNTSKSDIDHSHTESDISDLDKYTQAETNTISGSLSSEIDSDISTHTSNSDAHHNESHNVASHSDTTATGAQLNTLVGGGDTTLHKHDGQYYTESEVDILITTVSGKLDDHNEMNNLDYASAGHTGFQPAGNYATDSELTSTSGILQTDINTKVDKIVSVDNEIARFDSTGGDIQGYTSNAPTISDAGRMSILGGAEIIETITSHSATESVIAATMYGDIHKITGAYTLTLPAAVVGMSATFRVTTAAVFSIDCNASDHFEMFDGTVLGAGNKQTSGGTKNESIQVYCEVANTWITMDQNGTTLGLVHSGSVTQADMKLASVDAGAMIDIGVDWSAYAGNDVGNTPHMLVLYDSAGNRLQGFIGASGGGEAYGVELTTDGSMEIDPVANWEGTATKSAEADERTGGSGSQCLEGTLSDNGTQDLNQNQIISIGSLYKTIWWNKNITTSTSLRFQLWHSVDGSVFTTKYFESSGLKEDIIWTTHNVFVVGIGINLIIRFRIEGLTGEAARVDDVSFKQVTDISTNGVHLHSTRGGTNRNVASIDSGFDLNDGSGYTFEIYRYSHGKGLVSDAAYSIDWNGITDIAPSKNAVYDEMETKADKGANSDITSMTGLDDDGIPLAKVNGALGNIVEDTTPQLGGDLDAQGKYALQLQNIPDLAAKGAGYFFNGVSSYIENTDMANFSGDIGSILFRFTRSKEAWQVLCGCGDNASALYFLNFRLNSDGQLEVQQRANDSEDRLQCAPIIPLNTETVGVITSDGSAYTAYLNGKAETISVISGGNNGDWFGAITGRDNFTIGVSYLSNFGQYLSGSIREVLTFNIALPADEVKALSSGAPVPYKYIGASQTDRIIAAGDRNFDAGIGNWTSNIGGQPTSPANDLKMVINAAWDYAKLDDGFQTLVAGKRYEISLNIKEITGDLLYFSNGWGNVITAWDSTGVKTFDFTAVASNQTLYLALTGVATDYFVIDDISIIQIGCVLQLEQDGIGEKFWTDKSGNNLHGTVNGAVAINRPHQESIILHETTTPTAITNFGQLYTKSDNKVYFQDGAGSENELAKAGVNADIISMTGLEDDGIPGAKVVASTETAEGVSERATDTETLTGTDTTRHISPASLKYVLDRQDYYGVSWDESQATGGYTRTGRLSGFATSQSLADALLPIQASMRRCILNDSGVVQYYLDSTTSYNRNGQAPYISGQDDAGVSYKVSDGITVSGTDDVGTAKKISDVGVFSAAASEYVGKWVHNTTDDTYALITAKDSNDVLSINVDVMDIGETFIIGVLSAPASEYEGHYVKNTTDTTYALITAKDSDTALSIDADIMVSGENFEICTAALDGTDGQVMTEIPAFYYKYGYSGTTHTWEISLHPLPGFSIHPAFIKNDEFVPYRYYSSYEGILYDVSTSRYTNGLRLSAVSMVFANATSLITCASLSHPFTLLEAGDKFVIGGTTLNNGVLTVASKTDQTITTVEALTDETAGSTTLETEKNWTATTGDVLSSVSGKAPINYGYRSNFRAASATRGAGWRQQDFDLVSAIQLLYITEYADWNSQSMIGAGLTNFGSTNWANWSNYNPIENTGLSNTLGNVSGGVDNGANTTGSYMSYRGIENFFGHLWKWIDGINVNDNIPYVSNNDTQFADDTASNYTDLGIVLATSDGYQKTLEQQSRGFLPASVGGASNTYITDYYYQNTGWRVPELGGRASDGANAGVAYLYLYFLSSDRYQHHVGRLAY